jgi:glycosyltransferase involved in cell wall biosynthesis
MVYGSAHLIAPLVLVSVACVRRVDAARRRARGDLPRVVWGPTPIINIKYWSQALRRYGFESSTLVYSVYPAFKREDFDRHLDDCGPRSPRFRYLAPYFAFAWCLDKADVFVFAYDGGYLRHTPLRWWECQLIRLAGKRIVLIPFGGDIAIPGTLGPVEAGVYSTYPSLLERADEIRRRILYFCKYADFAVRTYQPGFQPRQDLLWPNGLAIDTDSWKPIVDSDGADARRSEVVIVHPTNHRSIKGTDFLITAVKELADEGLHIRLEIMEGQPNEDVRAAMAVADMVGEQFIAGYGLTGVEAMALGRPVLSNLTWLGPEFWEGTYLLECPIVNTTPETLKDDVRRLAIDPELRGRLGRAGREYALKYHSAEAVGRIWNAILRHVWLHEPVAPKVSAAFLSGAETA